MYANAELGYKMQSLGLEKFLEKIPPGKCQDRTVGDILMSIVILLGCVEEILIDAMEQEEERLREEEK